MCFVVLYFISFTSFIEKYLQYTYLSINIFQYNDLNIMTSLDYLATAKVVVKYNMYVIYFGPVVV